MLCQRTHLESAFACEATMRYRKNIYFKVEEKLLRELYIKKLWQKKTEKNKKFKRAFRCFLRPTFQASLLSRLHNLVTLLIINPPALFSLMCVTTFFSFDRTWHWISRVESFGKGAFHGCAQAFREDWKAHRMEEWKFFLFFVLCGIGRVCAGRTESGMPHSAERRHEKRKRRATWRFARHLSSPQCSTCRATFYSVSSQFWQ